MKPNNLSNCKYHHCLTQNSLFTKRYTDNSLFTTFVPSILSSLIFPLNSIDSLILHLNILLCLFVPPILPTFIQLLFHSTLSTNIFSIPTFYHVPSYQLNHLPLLLVPLTCNPLTLYKVTSGFLWICPNILNNVLSSYNNYRMSRMAFFILWYCGRSSIPLIKQ